VLKPSDGPTIEDFGDIWKAASHAHATFDSGLPWWRGHAHTTWNLHPSVYRDEFVKRDHRKPGSLESSSFARFRNQRPSRHKPIPPNWDTASWLLLMRHYGLPTRLLDWTESILVALYFATADEKNDNIPGCLWALSPLQLNSAEGLESLPEPDHPRVKQLFTDARTTPPEQHQENQDGRRILALSTSEFDSRMVAQSARYTIHGRSENLGSHAKADTFLLRYLIPERAKRSLRLMLMVLGVREEQLYPDLEHLAASLMRMYGNSDVQEFVRQEWNRLEDGKPAFGES
jgi:hypothetical protein